MAKTEVDLVMDILEEQVSDVEFKFKISVKQLRDLLAGKPAFIEIRGETYGLIRKQALEMIVRQQRRQGPAAAPGQSSDKPMVVYSRGEKHKKAVLLVKAFVQNRGAVTRAQLIEFIKDEGLFAAGAVYRETDKVIGVLTKEKKYYNVSGAGMQMVIESVPDVKGDPAKQGSGDIRGENLIRKG